MVTAVVIPLLFCYFYYITRKEQKEIRKKWRQIGKVAAESVIKGTIVNVQEKTEHYYHNYYIYVIDLLLQCKNEKIIARMQLPVMQHMQKPSFEIGETIVCYGQRNNDLFLFSTYQTASTALENLAYNIDQPHRHQDG
ncbi:hypothetical protein [Anoxybacteroides tepidamans]|uniref:hypothetical protein n=1 Tax=Anoxybacteroides tepidamans TaxID=265948 RepID=UPI0006890795|nr:hypothetical protein [Anoxybacillus tepidamans]